RLRAYLAPGYPLFLAGMMRVFSDVWWLPAAMNLLFHALTTLVLFDLVRQLIGVAPALFACAVLALWPSQIMVSGLALTEPLSMLLFTVSFWALVGADTGGAVVRWALLAGLATGLGALVRPSVLATPGLFLLFVLFAGGRWHARLRFALLTGLVTVASITPW